MTLTWISRRRLMKKPRTRRPANTAEKPAKINRRSFVELLPAAGITGAAMTHLDATPGAATANAQQAQSQTAQKVTKETLRVALAYERATKSHTMRPNLEKLA